MERNDIQIRRAGLSDLSEMCRIEMAAHINPWSENLLKDSLQNNNLAWVMEVDNQVIGHMVVLPIVDEWELLNVVVDPDRQGRGLGKRWMEFLVSESSDKNISDVLLEVRESNKAAIGLYLSSGFKKVGMRKNYYSNKTGKENAVLMTRTIIAT